VAKYEKGSGRVCGYVCSVSTSEGETSEASKAIATTLGTWLEIGRHYYVFCFRFTYREEGK